MICEPATGDARRTALEPKQAIRLPAGWATAVSHGGAEFTPSDISVQGPVEPQDHELGEPGDRLVQE
jgi:hypothetical protein